MNAADASRYINARQAAYRAWLATQPQFVIPGVLEGVDATRADGDGCDVRPLEPIPDVHHSPWSWRRGGFAPPD